MNPTFTTIDLGRMAYAHAYEEQGAYLASVLAARDTTGSNGAKPGTASSGGSHVGYVLLVEHDPPVITVTRRPASASHLLADPNVLARDGIEVAQTDRGGDITYHGPGQLVVYPILDLNLLKLRLHDYMRLLESAVMDACSTFGVDARRDACATGVWVEPGSRCDGMSERPCDDRSAKICAMGVRVRRWISMHGLALNVTTNLEHFNHIVPCGLPGRRVTSLLDQLGGRCPSMEAVKQQLTASLAARLTTHVNGSSHAGSMNSD